MLELKHLNITQWDRSKLNYFGITKAGNSYVKHCLYQFEHPDHDLDDVDIFINNFRYSFYIPEEDALENGYENFTVVRDPVQRFRSAWYDLNYKRPDRGRHAGMLGGEPWSMEYTLEWLREIPDEERDVHFKSQSSFVRPYLTVLHLENLNEEWPYDVPLLETRVNAGKRVDVDSKIQALIEEIYADDFNL